MRPLLVALLVAVPLSSGICSAARVIAVDVNGVVQPITVEIVSRAIDQAKREKADAILLRLNTPGGLLESTRQINEKLIDSPIPVITYVTPSGGRAASAGFLLLETGDVAVMAPATNTGAASPVLIGQQMDSVMRAKIENDSAAGLRAMTQKRGRNSDLAEKAIREAKAFTEKEALDNHLIDLIASDEKNLFSQLNGREITRFDGRKQKLNLSDVQVANYELSTRQSVIAAVSDPNIGFILLALGALGVYVEFSHPGLILPGVIGAIMALLGLSSLSVMPINWIGASLLILALAMFVLEAKFTSHGILGIGGAVAMVLGAMLLIDAPPELRIHLDTALAVTLPFALITIFLVSLVFKARANKVITGLSAMLNEIGEARTPLAPKGTIFVRGEYWEAVSSAPVESGAKVRVSAVDGLLLRVEPV
jgi:membrane-bound serine protease (ClpP class)